MNCRACQMLITAALSLLAIPPALAQNRDAIGDFIERKEKSNVLRHDIIVSRGLENTYKRLLDVLPNVDVTLPTGSEDSPPEQVRKLQNVFLNDVALYATALGVATNPAVKEKDIISCSEGALELAGRQKIMRICLILLSSPLRLEKMMTKDQMVTFRAKDS